MGYGIQSYENFEVDTQRNTYTFTRRYERDTDETIDATSSTHCEGYWGNQICVKITWDNYRSCWRFEGGVYNQMADYMSNSWDTWGTDFYDDFDKACEAAAEWMDRVVEEEENKR